MARSTQTITFIFLAFAILSCGESEKTQPPNIILILADDLGYGDLGCYGQQIIETPNIDALAANGMRFTQHYSAAPVCAPARCMLLTGKHAGNAYIRGNDEWAARGAVWNYDSMNANPILEGQRPLPQTEITMAQLLKGQGYKTGMVGKWGLGGPMTGSVPTTRGFDFFYGYNCQRQAHTYYPMHLWKNEEKVALNNISVAPRTKLPDGADPADRSSYDLFNLNDYSGDLMFTEVTNFVAENAQEPFFMYWATPIPHLPLQADDKWLAYYEEKLGPEDPYVGNRGYFPHPAPRAAYAAMISYLDEQVGLLVQQLKDLGVYDNTLIIFTSDNGGTYDIGGIDTDFFNSNGDFGAAYGYGKGFVREGGIRVPMIASWPAKVQAGTTSDHQSIFYDYLATFGDIAGVSELPPNDGVSFLPTLLSEETQPKHDYLYWEFPGYQGQVAIRRGNEKFIWGNLLKEDSMALYDLGSDLLETNNLLIEQPERASEFLELIKANHTTPDIERFKIAPLDSLVSL